VTATAASGWAGSFMFDISRLANPGVSGIVKLCASSAGSSAVSPVSRSVCPGRLSALDSRAVGRGEAERPGSSFLAGSLMTTWPSLLSKRATRLTFSGGPPISSHGNHKL